MADGEVEWFEQSWKREKPLRFTPASLSIAETGLSGKKSLISVGPTAEEVHCTGIHTGGAEDANAIQLSIKKEAPGLRNTLLGAGPAEPLDVLIFVTPKGKLFPWDRFEPSDELRASRKGGFDYQFTYREICDRTDIDFAVYQAPRFLAPGKWTTLTVPFADFTCVYGAGAYRERFLKHEEIGGGDVIAVAWINPWSRQGDRRSEVTIHLDEVAFARLPGAPAELRSYWQIPGREKIRLVPEGEGPRQIRHMLLRDEK